MRSFDGFEARRVPALAGTAGRSRGLARIRGEATDDWNDQVAPDRARA
ncbi:hypothetical protein PUR34_15120 [Streptomyces sp. JV185]|nr:hypothetical protein [Streptomyces sp. JV185]MEE1769440.1 hypothetical protein [Streptomyces sp. JV185]